MDLILVGYSESRTRAALKFCSHLTELSRNGRRVLVLNAGERPSGGELIGWTCVRGSNQMGEFSGWQEGLAVLGEERGAPGVAFLNDTVGAHRHLSRFMRGSFMKDTRAILAHGVVGFSDSPPKHADFQIAGMALSGWVSTYCFAMSNEVLRLLGNELFRTGEIDACVRGGLDPQMFFSEQVSPALRAHLIGWLFGGGWYQSEPLTEKNSAKMVFKARCICAELLLSARCQRLGVGFRNPSRHHPVRTALDGINAWIYGATHDGRPRQAE